MKYREILREMSRAEARAIWIKHGVDPDTVPADLLGKARNSLIKRMHPDVGGNLEDAKLINAAYDVLKKPSGAAPNAPGHRQETDYPIWAQAGYSGGLPETGHIFRQDYRDVNYIKKRMWELSGKSTEAWTIWGFDGRFMRGVTTVYGSPKIFAQMAEAMNIWQTKGGNPYECRAVLVTKRKPSKDEQRIIYLIWADGVFYDKKPIPITYDSFNQNPSNDRSFDDRLRRLIDDLQEQGGRQHEQPSMDTRGEAKSGTHFETGSYVVHPKYGVGRVVNPLIRKGVARVTFKKDGVIKTGNVRIDALRKATEQEQRMF